MGYLSKGAFAWLMALWFSAAGWARPVDIMLPEALAKVRARFPKVIGKKLNAILNNPDTMWYDNRSIIPGYQDSAGDNTTFPIGMRPNTIRANMIAVPGGHGWLFVRRGQFHFPFGRTGGADSAQNTHVVDFWLLPQEKGQHKPVVWWKYEPNGFTSRIHWMFPKGTVFGEIIFIIDEFGTWYPFEIRTRTRALDEWEIDVYRPFPTAEDLGFILDWKRRQKPQWKDSKEITDLIVHTWSEDTLESKTLSATNYTSAFSPVQGAVDFLPALRDNTILKELLMEIPFQSVRGRVWKEKGSLKAYAASTHADFSIVPKNYEAGLFEVTNQFCQRCHRDAGRPFKDFYFDVYLYGELWGDDETFSWHPFENQSFVNSNGDTVNFNHDNRKFRSDFISSGILEKYDTSKHTTSFYSRIRQDWHNFRY